MFRIKGTVILKIWWQIALIIIYTGGLVCIHTYVDDWEIKFPMTLIPVLGVVTGLLLVFRTNTAYDRYLIRIKILFVYQIAKNTSNAIVLCKN